MPRLFLLLVLSVVAFADEEAPAPRLPTAFKVRFYNLIDYSTSSAAFGRVGYSFWADVEQFLAPRVSASLSGGRQKVYMGAEDFSLDSVHAGLLITYYLGDDLSSGAFYVRSHCFGVWPTTGGFGIRVGPELGLSIEASPFLFDVGAGLSFFLKNPHRRLKGANEYRVPDWMRDLFFEASDVFPTLNASVGVVF